MLSKKENSPCCYIHFLFTFSIAISNDKMSLVSLSFFARFFSFFIFIKKFKSSNIFFYRRRILRTFHIAVDFLIVLYEGLYGRGEMESPPPAKQVPFGPKKGSICRAPRNEFARIRIIMFGAI